MTVMLVAWWLHKQRAMTNITRKLLQRWQARRFVDKVNVYSVDICHYDITITSITALLYASTHPRESWHICCHCRTKNSAQHISATQTNRTDPKAGTIFISNLSNEMVLSHTKRNGASKKERKIETKLPCFLFFSPTCISLCLVFRCCSGTSHDFRQKLSEKYDAVLMTLSKLMFVTVFL